MTTPSTTSDSGTEYANLTVSTEFRDAVRVAKAKQGLSYEDYLRQHLPDDIEGTG
jgi:predicted DNA binding CopG/RHH family protein